MDGERFDLAVIGTGPGGEGAAMQAAKRGRKVVVIERFRRVGGGCTHWGTIPSKALRYHVSQVMRAQQNVLLRPFLRNAEFTFVEMLKAAESVISAQEDLRQGFYERNGVPVIRGDAAFMDEHTLVVSREDGAVERIEAEKIIIAVGSRPYRPENVDFNHPNIYDSDTILTLDRRPFSITIYGAGVIGCEYASIFKNLGMKVNLINTRDRLLEFLDDEITDALSYHLRDQGVTIRHGERYKAVIGEADGVVLELDSGKKIKTDILLWANGRTGNTDTLGLENAGLSFNARGQIEVDESYRTAKEHIYAVGDVVGFPSLASAAYDQGRFAAIHCCDGCCDRRLVASIPVGIYTSPEISAIGKTERELTEEKVPYEVGQALFRSLARAQMTGVRVGMLKILFHRETYRVLGIHCFGHNAAEIVHIGQAIMEQEGEGNDVHYFANTTFNYPTMAEAYRVAALNGINRIF